MEWIQISDTQGVNMSRIVSWTLLENEHGRCLSLECGVEGFSWGVEGKYIDIFLDVVGYVAPGMCRNCGGEGTLTVGSMSGARELDCEPCDGTGKAKA